MRVNENGAKLRAGIRSGAEAKAENRICTMCDGKGSYCCHSWKEAYLDGAFDAMKHYRDDEGIIKQSGPVWRLRNGCEIEMAYCPFCGEQWL